jgi:hypothetical protein
LEMTNLKADADLAGRFIVFPMAIGDKNDYYQASRFGLGVFAITLLSVGYMLSILLCFICQSWLFLQDAIFLYVDHTLK